MSDTASPVSLHLALEVLSRLSLTGAIASPGVSGCTTVLSWDPSVPAAINTCLFNATQTLCTVKSDESSKAAHSGSKTLDFISTSTTRTQ